MSARCVIRRVGSLVLLLALMGCSTKFGMLIQNDKFAYPNSNVEPLGKVSSSMSEWSFMAPTIVDKRIYEKLKAEAVQQKGGDMIINAKLTTKVLMIPVIPILRTDVTLEGTAAKQTIGRQELK